MWAYTNSIKSTYNSSGVGRSVKDNITSKQVTYKFKHILIFLVKVDFAFYCCEKLGQIIQHFWYIQEPFLKMWFWKTTAKNMHSVNVFKD